MDKKSYRQALQSATDTVGDLIEKIQRLSQDPRTDPKLILRLNLELWEPIVPWKSRQEEIKVLEEEYLGEDNKTKIKTKKTKKTTDKPKLEIGRLF